MDSKPTCRTIDWRWLSPSPATIEVDVPSLRMQAFGTVHTSDRHLLAEHLAAANGARQAAEVLVRKAWGSYVAFFEDAAGCSALRDPSGAVPLFIARSADVQIAATLLTPDILGTAGVGWSIDAAAIVRALAYPPYAGYGSALHGVEIATPGELVSLAEPVTRSIAWSPAAFARHSSPLPADVLRSKLEEVTSAMAGAYRIGVELSGGFDSSAVCATLAGLGLAPRAFNVVTASKGGDEAHYAHAVARHLGIELTVRPAGGDLPDYRAFEHADPGVQPILHGLDSVFAAARQEFIDQERVDAVMTGQGGDALFFRLPTRLIAADRRLGLGMKSLLTAAIVDDARRVRGSVWSVLATALGRRRGDDRAELEALTPHLLSSAAKRSLPDRSPRHPWLNDVAEIAPAKVLHLMMLSHCQLFHGGRLHPSGVPVLHPLLAQPLVELALACPTYHLQSGPLDRALAREAMSGRLPDVVLRRRNKGEASDHYARAILHNRDWLRGWLLEGRLVGTGLLDRAAVQRALEPDALRLGTDYRAFVQYASIESWMRYWS